MLMEEIQFQNVAKQSKKKMQIFTEILALVTKSWYQESENH